MSEILSKAPPPRHFDFDDFDFDFDDDDDFDFDDFDDEECVANREIPDKFVQWHNLLL